MENDFEKLGVFYLGKTYDLKSQKAEDSLLLYDSKDLVTHAVCVGMTGSGKTGLCLALIEEAALDGIPAILIDPKGDLANLLLTFPDLDPSDFEPWVNPDDARNKGMTVPQYAAQQAQNWAKGLSSWGEDGARIRKLQEAVDFRIYTPGSNSGIPVSILHSFAAPPQAQREDNELMRDRVITTVTSLLQLVGIDADPNQSREAIFMANLLDHNWRQGVDLSLEALILQIQNPPFRKIGVMDLDMYYPAKERFSLLMALNNLLASPGFNLWLQGDPLDISDIIRSPQGKPRVAIFSIAHLSDAERMFFVSLLLNQVLGWIRSQSGTTSLRTILYMDEIFGFLPPTANPASKLPMITLLKQARAFGLGLVLATQNPVDLDYKALSNAGTWFIGRLQTERDKARLIEGLEGAAATQSQKFDKQKMEQTIAGLGNRVFLMNNTHDDAPVVFTTRWVMSYMRGPLTRDQIKVLMDPIKKSAPESAVKPSLETNEERTPAAPSGSGAPTLPPEIQPVYLPVKREGRETIYYPAVLAASRLRFLDAKLNIDRMETGLFATFITGNAIPVDWQKGKLLKVSPDALEQNGKGNAAYADLPDAGMQKANYPIWSRDFLNWVVAAQPLTLLRSPSRGLISEPGESERDFRVRVAQTKRENRDDQLARVREKFTTRIQALRDKLDKAEIRVAKERGQATNAALSLGASMLGALTGRRISGSKISTALRGVGRSTEQSNDVRQAKESVKDLQDQLKTLEAEFEEEKMKMGEGADPMVEELEQVQVRLKKADITVQLVTLAWLPFNRDETGKLAAAW